MGMQKGGQETFSENQAICNRKKKKRGRERELRIVLVLNYIRAITWLSCVHFLKRPQTLGPANPLQLPLSAGKGQILNGNELLKSIFKQRY